jgi:hypothetical protein
MKLTYQILMFITLVAIVASGFYTINLFNSLDSTSGNGGSFLSAFLLAVGSFGLFVITILSTLAFSLAFVFQDKLPNGKIYHWLIPLGFSIPGYAVCLFIIYKWIAAVGI